jgi:hypothetical protein
MLRRFRALARRHPHRDRRAHDQSRDRAAAAAVVMESVEGRFLFSTFTVTNSNDSGAGSLRQAILDANKTTAADTIKFSIGSGQKTISPKTALPGISQPTILDATTQPGFAGKPLIELSGAAAGHIDGLKLTGTGITVKGLIVDRFGGSGIFIWGKGGNKIVGCWIGTDKTGSVAAGNKANGIIVQSPNNTIGGTSAAERNVISGNGTAGVLYYLAAASNNKILGNYVGTDCTGSKAIANHVGVQINGAANVTVGGSVAGSRNVISGNTRDGVLMVTGGTHDNTVQGNYIGTNAAGNAKIPNKWYGVEISQPHNLVGGTTSAARNVISGNGMDGVVFYLSTGTNNRCEGNFIGTDATGTRDLGNTGAGACATNGATNNIIGGSTSASRNIIAGNDLCGVGIYNGANSNQVKNNYLGVGCTGMTLPNTKQGVFILGSSNTVVQSNRIALSGAYSAVQTLSGSGTVQSSNSLYANVAAGLKVV